MRYTFILALILLSACAFNHKESDKQTSTTSQPSASQTSAPQQSTTFKPLPLAAKAYQAIYSCPKNFIYTTEHFYSDGAGHARIDLSGQGSVTPTVIQVLDLNSNQLMSWSLSDNKFFRRRAQPTDPLFVRCRMVEAMNNVDSLGSKVIDGHQCHGWKGALGTEIWFDDNYGCLVQGNFGGITTTLTSFSSQAPDPSLFQPPQGYIEVPSH